MKANRIIYILITCLFLSISCKDKLSLPSVRINEITYKTSVSAVVTYSISDSGATGILTSGICYSLKKNPNLRSNVIYSSGSDLNNFIGLVDLQSDSTYYVKAFAYNHEGISYSEEIEFRVSQRDSVIDTRDQKAYTTAQIGNKIWMIENMRHYLDTTLYYNNDSDLYVNSGKLYRYYEAMQACPDGWRLPSDQDWNELEVSAGLSEGETTQWNTWIGQNSLGKLILPGNNYWDRIDLGFTNELSFSLKGSGAYLMEDSAFHFYGIRAYYWTSTELNDSAVVRIFAIDTMGIQRKYLSKRNALSVRCVKDLEE